MKIRFTDMVHFILGFFASILHLSIPVTIIFAVYEVADMWIQIKAKEEEDCREWFCYLEEKYELRKDLGLYVFGLMVGSVLALFES